MNEEEHSSSPKSESKSSGLVAFWAELKRRKVMRVAITYAVVAWLLIQVSATVFPQFDIPDWGARFVTLLLVIGFPIALILAWAFELTPDGIKTTKAAEEKQSDAPVSKKQQRKRNLFSLIFAAAVPTLIFGTLAIFFYFRSYSVGPAIDGEKSIAVLPLENLSPDEENAFFAAGVQEDILTNLSRVDELRVISRTSTQIYKETTKNLRQIGEELGVRYLVEGSVRRANDQVRVTVQLIDAKTDEHLWAENYNRTLDDIFGIQAEVATQIAAKLEAALSPEEIAGIEYRPTENQEAYDAYVEAKWLIENRSAMGDEKIALLENAVALDPTFAEAWAQLAVECIWWWAQGTNRSDSKLRIRAHVALEQAKNHGKGLPNIPHAESEIHFFENLDTETSIAYLKEALTIDPKYYLSSYFLGARLYQIGRFTEAEQYFRAAYRMDPLSERLNLGLISLYALMGRWEDANELLSAILEVNPDSEIFRALRIQFQFLESGSLSQYISDFDSTFGDSKSTSLRLNFALLRRDYDSVIRLDVVDTAERSIHWSRGTTLALIGGHGIHFGPIELIEALALFETDRFEEAQAQAQLASKHLEGLIKKDPLISPNIHVNLAICYALLSEQEKMESMITTLREIAKKPFWEFMSRKSCEFQIAIAYLIAGDENSALATLEAANDLRGANHFDRELQLWFMFDRLKGNPRFEALLRGEVLGPSDVVENSVPEKSIAVLPLENMSPDSDNAFFADGVQEDILTNLSKIKDLLVISRSSTLQYRNPERNLKEIGEALGVRYLVEGSVRRAGNRVLVTTQLIDTQTDGHLWAENYNRELTDIFAIQAEVAKKIAGKLHAVISPTELEKIEYRPTENQRAYDNFIQARQGTFTLDPDEIIRLLEEAVALDPHFTEAWSNLSSMLRLRAREHHPLMINLEVLDDTELIARADFALSQAQRLGPDLPSTLYSTGFASIPLGLGFREREDRYSAIDELLEILAIDPTYLPAHQVLVVIYRRLGRLAEAQHHGELVLRQDPLSQNSSSSLAVTYGYRRQWEKIRALATKNLSRTEGLEHKRWAKMLAEVDFFQYGDRAQFVSAMEVVPGFMEELNGRAWKALEAREFDDALKQFADFSPSSFFHFFGSSVTMGPLKVQPIHLVSSLILFETGEIERSRFEAKKAKDLLGAILNEDAEIDPYYLSNLAIAHALLGETSEMENVINENREITATPNWNYRRRSNCETRIAMAYLVLGDHDKAIETLETASKLDSPMFLNRELDLWFIFDRLRGNPRFDALLKN